MFTYWLRIANTGRGVCIWIGWNGRNLYRLAVALFAWLFKVRAVHHDFVIVAAYFWH
jgi:hypothetical protein